MGTTSWSGDLMLVSLTSWPVDPHCLTTKPGSAFNFCCGICRQKYVFVEMLTFVFEAIACGTLVAASVPEGATFVEVPSHPSKDIWEQSEPKPKSQGKVLKSQNYSTKIWGMVRQAEKSSKTKFWPPTVFFDPGRAQVGPGRGKMALKGWFYWCRANKRENHDLKICQQMQLIQSVILSPFVGPYDKNCALQTF